MVRVRLEIVHVEWFLLNEVTVSHEVVHVGVSEGRPALQVSLVRLLFHLRAINVLHRRLVRRGLGHEGRALVLRHHTLVLPSASVLLIRHWVCRLALLRHSHLRAGLSLLLVHRRLLI